MADAVVGTTLVDLILAAMAIELVVLRALRARRGGRAVTLAWNFAAGACLLLALRGALADAAPAWIAAALAGALVAHALDLRARLR